MTEHFLAGLDGSDPLGFLAALGLLRVTTHVAPEARLRWVDDGGFRASLTVPDELDPVRCVTDDLERWRAGHAAVDFAVDAHRKVQDLKHPPADFRALMRSVAGDAEAAGFVAAYATGVTVDGSGQTKPTSLHMCAGKQRFMDAVLSLRAEVTPDDIAEALHGPWKGRVGPKNLRWRAAAERLRALLSFDPSKESAATIAGANWLAFQALPLFPTVPRGRKTMTTTAFVGRGKREQMVWPIWAPPLSLPEVRTILGTASLTDLKPIPRRARGIVRVFEAAVVRSDQGYGSFAAATPR